MRCCCCCTYISIVKQTFRGDPASRPYRNSNNNNNSDDRKVRFYARASHNTQLTPLHLHLPLCISLHPSSVQHSPLVLGPFRSHAFCCCSCRCWCCSAPRQILLFPTCRYCIFALNIFEMLLRSVNEINALRAFGKEKKI